MDSSARSKAFSDPADKENSMNMAAMPMVMLLADNKVRTRARLSARVDNLRLRDHLTVMLQPD